jgi:hypothetical protein
VTVEAPPLETAIDENATELRLVLRIGVDEADGVDFAVAVGIELDALAPGADG